MTISRRGLITGLICFTAAPAIVRIESLMPVKAMEPYGIGPMMDYNYEIHLWLERIKRDIIEQFRIPNEFLKEPPHVVTQGPYCRIARNVQGPVPDNHGPDGIPG